MPRSAVRDREGLASVDNDFIEEMGHQIRRALNEHRSGIGDQAICGKVDTVWEQDTNIIKLVNLTEQWKLFRQAKQGVDDKLAAIKEVEEMFSKITC